MLPLALAWAVASAAPGLAPPDLVAALMHNKDVAGCAGQASDTPQKYVTRSFLLSEVTLRSGEHMTVAQAQDPCLAHNSVNRVLIFEHTASGYRSVLDDYTLPGQADVSDDGTVTFASHESMMVIFEATYVWNGKTYVFSGPRSHRYDVAIGQRRLAEVPVRFAPGTFATTLSGTVAFNFGDDYDFDARAGQRVTIDASKTAGHHASVSLYYGDDTSSIAELFDTYTWSGVLSKTGTYHLLVDGTNEHDEGHMYPYEIRLTIR